MQQHARAVRHDTASEEVWFCHHPPIYTTGRRGVDNRTRPELPAPLLVTDRGGETTFHGPGQLLCYPIIDLKRRRIAVRRFVALLEESCIGLLAGCRIAAGRRAGLPGVWSARGKIAAIGLRIDDGVSRHGMALNVTTDPAWFAPIRPCGLEAGIDRIADHTSPPPLETLAGSWFRLLVALLSGEGRGQ